MVSTSKAFLPQKLIQSRSESLITQAAVVLSGVVAVSLLAQISIPIPGTPVPVTGQTLGVSVMALLFGRRLGGWTIILYILASAFGLPILAMGRALTFGPTVGYLFGMAVSVIFIGELADRGWTRNFWSAFLACLLGSVFVFGFGLWVLSRFIPHSQVLASGLYPFIPGDLFKSLIAACVSEGARVYIPARRRG